MQFEYSDGGRSKYFRGSAGDCVTRAVAIATGLDYKHVYDTLSQRQYEWANTSRSKVAKKARKLGKTSRKGIYKQVYRPYLVELGWTFTPTMSIGSGCTVHMRSEELPSGTIIVKLSKHLAVVRDGVLLDTHDCTRSGTRCVYGYWSK